MSPKISTWGIVLLCAVVGGLIGSFIFYTQVPFNWFSSAKPSFGTTITTINGSDRISDSRTTINNNFSSLNTNKFELSDWYATTSAPQITTEANLVTVGALSSGSLASGFTVVGATLGGTGQSTVTSGDILYGSASNVWSKLAKGSDGDFLTLSSGVPAWTTSAIDKSAAYLWTGVHNFTNAATLIKGLVASTTVTFNNGGSSFSYIFTNPGSHASSTLLMLDASGNVFERYSQNRVFALNSNANVSTTNSASTSVLTLPVPANTFTGTYKIGRVTVFGTNKAASGNCFFGLDYGNGAATTSVGFVKVATGGGSFVSTMMATSSAAEMWTSTTVNNTSASRVFSAITPIQAQTFGVTDLTAASMFGFIVQNDNGSATCQLNGYSIEILSP